MSYPKLEIASHNQPAPFETGTIAPNAVPDPRSPQEEKKQVPFLLQPLLVFPVVAFLGSIPSCLVQAMDVAALIEQSFSDKKIHSFYLDTPKDINQIPPALAIIDSPEINLASPWMGHDITATVNRLLDAAEQPPSTRLKDVASVIAGQGKGKTRFLEELRLAICQRPTAVALAITFNNSTDLSKDSAKWKAATTAENVEFMYAMAVLSRILHATLGGEFSTKIVHRLNPIQFLPFAPGAIIQGGLRFFLAFLPVKTHFVLLVDEAVKAHRVFSSGDRDVTSVVRTALLDSPIQEGVHATLVLSSLNVTPFGDTSSSRAILPLLLAHALDAHQVIREWWHVESKPVSILAASLLSSVPRLVQIAAGYLVKLDEKCKLQPKKPHSSPTGIVNESKQDSSWLKNLMSEVITLTRRRYGGDFRFPSPENFYNLVYGVPVDPADTEVAGLLLCSIFVNSVAALERFIPQANIVTLFAAAQQLGQGNPCATLLGELLPVTEPGHFNLFDTVNSGDALEFIARQMVLLRLQAVMAWNEKNGNIERKIPVRVFFGWNPGEFLPVPLDSKKDLTIEEATGKHESRLARLTFQAVRIAAALELPSLRNNSLQFWTTLNATETESGLAVVAKSAKGDCFDLLITLDSHVFLIDTKSGQVDTTEAKKKVVRQSSLLTSSESDGKSKIEAKEEKTQELGSRDDQILKQSEYFFRTLTDHLASAEKLEPVEGSIYHSVIKKQVTFIFLSSSGGKSFRKGHTIVMRAQATENFLSFLWVYYRAIRAGINC
jgi:hypothetical protein